MKWISVKDKLPSVGEWYIVVTSQSLVTMSFYDNRIDGEIVSECMWLTHNDEYREPTGNWEWDSVTHWMPLPEPPK